MQGKLLKGCTPAHYWWQSSQNHNIWDRGEVRGRLLLAKIVGCCIPCSINLCGCIGYIYCWNDFSNGLWAKNLSNLPQIASRLCGMHISETAGWIYPIWNFMDLQLARPVVVQCRITHAPLFRGGADNVYESALGDSSLVMNIHNSVEVRQEYCRAHHLTGNYRTASDTWIQVSTNRNASPWRRLHWRHDDRKMTSQWCARTFGGVTREVSSYIMMHMHGGFGKPRSFPHQLICGGPTFFFFFFLNIHNSFMDCATSQYLFKPRDVIMLMRAVTIVAA